MGLLITRSLSQRFIDRFLFALYYLIIYGKLTWSFLSFAYCVLWNFSCSLETWGFFRPNFPFLGTVGLSLMVSEHTHFIHGSSITWLSFWRPMIDFIFALHFAYFACSLLAQRRSTLPCHTHSLPSGLFFLFISVFHFSCLYWPSVMVSR